MRVHPSRIVIAAFLVALPVGAQGQKTALDDYIAKPDPAFSWKVVGTDHASTHDTYVVDLKSQTWRTKADVNRTLWEHALVVVKPKEVKHKTALLLIGGGRNGRPAPTAARKEYVAMALATNSVVVELGMVPNQPLVFHEDGKERNEDDLIAYAWIQYLKTGDATWLPRLPMVKSAVRAMDAVAQLTASKEGGSVAIDSFVVAGASKRGWTTWLTGAADPRVKAIVPIVIDVVNVRPSMDHHYSAYGFWAPAVHDYVDHGVTNWMNTPEYQKLLRIVDPYFYRDRLTMPKFIVNAAGDQFFLPDSSQFYFHDLKGQKYLRYVPNADHSLRDTDALQSIQAFHHAVLTGAKLPEFTWSAPSHDSIHVKAKATPKAVTLWQASNPKTRDFRLETIGKAYRSSSLEPTSAGEYYAKVEKPASGWTAFFIELTFDSGGRVPYKFTTDVFVNPRELPHQPPKPTGKPES